MSKYLMFFGHRIGVQTQQLLPRVQSWCVKNDVELIYKDVTRAVREEYRIEWVPTIRYFDSESGQPRTEVVGSRINDFIHGRNEWTS